MRTKGHVSFPKGCSDLTLRGQGQGHRTQLSREGSCHRRVMVSVTLPVGSASPTSRPTQPERSTIPARTSWRNTSAGVRSARFLRPLWSAGRSCHTPPVALYQIGPPSSPGAQCGATPQDRSPLPYLRAFPPRDTPGRGKWGGAPRLPAKHGQRLGLLLLHHRSTKISPSSSRANATSPAMASLSSAVIGAPRGPQHGCSHTRDKSAHGQSGGCSWPAYRRQHLHRRSRSGAHRGCTYQVRMWSHCGGLLRWRNSPCGSCCTVPWAVAAPWATVITHWTATVSAARLALDGGVEQA